VKLPPLAATIGVTSVGLAGDGDVRLVIGGAGGSSGHGQKSGDQELHQIVIKLKFQKN
jgi:hypothetical protein